MSSEKVILVNSSKLKIHILERVFQNYFPERNFRIIDSGIDNFQGDSIPREDCLALMREKISEAKSLTPDAEYYVFMRGRMEDRGSQMEEFAIVMVQDKYGNEGVSDAASFEVPEKVATLVRSGVSFSTAVEEVYEVPGVKNGSGFVGILTKGIVMKEEQYFQPAVIALATCVERAR